MNERQECDSEMSLEMLSWEAADHDSPAHSLCHVYFTLLLGCNHPTDRSICSLQFVEGFMDSHQYLRHLRTLSASVLYILKSSPTQNTAHLLTLLN